MNSASQPDTPSEWSKFAPLPPRLRSNSALPLTENLAAADPSSETASTLSTTVPDNLTAPVLDLPGETLLPEPAAPPHPADQFVCQNRKCQDKRERHGKSPRPLFSAQWRAMKIGKRRTLVVELAVRCPECDFEHRATLVPPEWLNEQS